MKFPQIADKLESNIVILNDIPIISYNFNFKANSINEIAFIQPIKTKFSWQLIAKINNQVKARTLQPNQKIIKFKFSFGGEIKETVIFTLTKIVQNFNIWLAVVALLLISLIIKPKPKKILQNLTIYTIIFLLITYCLNYLIEFRVKTNFNHILENVLIFSNIIMLLLTSIMVIARNVISTTIKKMTYFLNLCLLLISSAFASNQWFATEFYNHKIFVGASWLLNFWIMVLTVIFFKCTLFVILQLLSKRLHKIRE